jgi:hypothetical protein
MRRRAVRQQEVRLRRELNSHDAAKPRTASQAQRGAWLRASAECGWIERPKTFKTRLSESQCTVQHETFSPRRRKDMDTLCHIAAPALLATIGFQSVREAAAARTGAHGPGRSSRRLEGVPRHHLRRGAGSTCSMAAGTTGFLAGWASALTGAALPNPSLERRPREACHPWAAQASRRLHYPARPKGGPPLGSPQLER